MEGQTGFMLVSSQKTDIRSLDLKALEELMKELDQPGYRAGQIFSWFHKKLARSFDEMTDIPAQLRQSLDGSCILKNLEIITVQRSKTDGTRKYLFGLYDGNTIESVFMKYSFGNSVCISTQVGCAMGCAFCASTKDGCVRNLSISEMLSQVYEIQRDTGERISHVVLMGMGEPLLNYENTVGFVKTITDENSLHISTRNITISTCGLPGRIERLSKEGLKITLAVSLHAPNDEIRKKIMPVAKKYSIDEVFAACKTYFENTGRRITFEYCLIGGLNDMPACAKELSVRLKGMNAHVNLICVNPTENKFSSPKEADIDRFIKILEDKNIQTTRRRQLGRDIDGACGQLKRRMS